VHIGPVEKVFGLAVDLVAEIPEMPEDAALALIQEAHLVCPYSNATRGNIVVNLSLAPR
jgi:osmotically inducible protein OsmC